MGNDRGVFCISRKLFDNDDPFFGRESFTRREAWQWLIAEAAWKPRRVRVNTGRGDTFIELNVDSFRTPGHYAKGVELVVGQARSDVSGPAGNGQSDRPDQRPGIGQDQCIITICKFDEYQFPYEDTGQASGHPSGQSSGHPKATQGPETKKYKKYNKRIHADALKILRSSSNGTRPIRRRSIERMRRGVSTA